MDKPCYMAGMGVTLSSPNVYHRRNSSALKLPNIFAIYLDPLSIFSNGIRYRCRAHGICLLLCIGLSLQCTPKSVGRLLIKGTEFFKCASSLVKM